MTESTLLADLEADLRLNVNKLFHSLDGDDSTRFALAIAGKVLPTIYESIILSEMIKKLFERCEAVIVYRSSPA